MLKNTDIKKVVIVGGVAGGANAAARLRRLNESIEIILIERSGYVSFANCGLPYHIGGEIKERKALLLHTPDSLKSRFNIDVRVNSEVCSIDRESKTVLVRERKTTRQYSESYDALILSPGAEPLRPSLEGIELPSIYSLRNIEDMDSILAGLSRAAPTHVLIVGAGFIGLEMLEQLHHRLNALDAQFTIVEKNPHILSPLDFEMVVPIEKCIRSKGVELLTGQSVVSFKKSERGVLATTDTGAQIDADFVLFNIGVRPEISLARDSGLTLGRRGGISVDSRLRTNDPNIFAVGDCIETRNLITGEDGVIPLAGPANRQGRIVADVICGIDSQYKGTLGTAIVRVFDLTAAVTGTNERTLKRLNIPYEAIYLHPNSHAGYYPGATPIQLKVLYSPSSKKILGAQALGKEGVDKRIDVIATSIQAGLSVDELMELELCYAPPFGSAKDPVNLVGMIAENVLEELVETVKPSELDAELPNTLLLDVRNASEREKGFIPNSIHIPLGELRSRISEIPRGQPLIVYCQSGQRSYNACRILTQHGFKCKNLAGAYASWKNVEDSRS